LWNVVRAKKPSFMVIDGSAVVWNGVLKAMCGETPLQYYSTGVVFE